VTLKMKDNTAQLGFIVKEEAGALTIKTASGQSLNIPKSDIESQSKLPASLMPEGLLQGLTQPEAADVIRYLEELK